MDRYETTAVLPNRTIQKTHTLTKDIDHWSYTFRGAKWFGIAGFILGFSMTKLAGYNWDTSVLIGMCVMVVSFMFAFIYLNAVYMDYLSEHGTTTTTEETPPPIEFVESQPRINKNGVPYVPFGPFRKYFASDWENIANALIPNNDERRVTKRMLAGIVSGNDYGDWIKKAEKENLVVAIGYRQHRFTDKFYDHLIDYYQPPTLRGGPVELVATGDQDQPRPI